MSTLATAREYLECALSQARSRLDYHVIGERICEIMEMQELEECRQLRPPTLPAYSPRKARRARGHMARATRERA